MKPLLLVTLFTLFGQMAAADATHLSHGRFKDLVVYTSVREATSFVLFLSGDAGWNRPAEALAEQLSQHGAMVVGIDLPKFKAVLEADGAQCVFPDGDLENLSHFVQAYLHNSTYLAPLLVGSAPAAAWRTRCWPKRRKTPLPARSAWDSAHT